MTWTARKTHQWPTDAKTIVHVVPDDDLALHVLDGTLCLCCPKPSPQGADGLLVTHNAWDMREDFEQEFLWV